MEDKFSDWDLNREDRRDMAALIKLAQKYLVNNDMQLELYVMSDCKWWWRHTDYTDFDAAAIKDYRAEAYAGRMLAALDSENSPADSMEEDS